MTDNDVIYSYSRADALADGVLVDVSEMAREAGIRFPVALTRAVWERCVVVPEAADWQDESGRLWDVLSMLRHAIRTAGSTSEIRFVVLVQNDKRSPQPVSLKSTCGPGDNLEPVVTVLFPEED